MDFTKIRFKKRAAQASGGVTVFLIVKNEAYILPHFLKHYRSLGVKHFLVYDDKSSDGTTEMLLAAPDCTVVISDNDFGDVVGQQTRALPRRFGPMLKTVLPRKLVPDGWTLTVDADEFLVLPMGYGSLDDLVAALDDLGQYHFAAPMVDFYPETLNGMKFPRDASPFEGCPFFDRGPMFDWSSGNVFPRQLPSGIRSRLLRRLVANHPEIVRAIYGNHPVSMARTWKVPLIRHGRGVANLSDHDINVLPNLNLMGTLAHFKFCPNLDDKIRGALASGSYYNGSMEYRFLAEAIRLFGDVSLLGEESVRFSGAASLEAAGLSASNKSGDVVLSGGAVTPLRAVPGPERRQWLERLWRMAEPVLVHAAGGKLATALPKGSRQLTRKRREFAPLEALARTLAGLAPWLEVDGLVGEEAHQQTRARELSRLALDWATDPGTAKRVNFSAGDQPLVDAAHLALALLRAPRSLWHVLPERVRQNVVASLLATRAIKPHQNNWLLFPALIEAFFCRADMAFDAERIETAIRQMDRWYVGDGMYTDGPRFHLDYYNSYVIHPFLLDILDAMRPTRRWVRYDQPILCRAQRYVVLLERSISPEGAMPVTGRSLVYRCGNLHALGQLALQSRLPPVLHPAQVRTAMQAVMQRTLDAPGSYDAQGWLTIGFSGEQPALGEDYISTGSPYLASLGFLPLGLPPQHAFWTSPELPYTSQRLYRGQDMAPDRAMP